MDDEAPRLLDARRGHSVAYQGKTLLSLVDPIAGAERVATAAPVFERTLYFCPSPLFGYGLRALLDRMAPGSAVFCVEADQKLMQLGISAFEPDLLGDSRLRYLRTDDAASACAYLRKEFGPRRFRRVATIKLSGAFSLFSQTYDAIEAALRTDIGLDWSNAMTLVRLGRRYALNAVRNLSRLPYSNPLGNVSLGSAPVLVLGAGPSLDQALESLNPSEPRNFRILCVDTALIPLMQRGIKPDLVVALEAQQWNLRDFVGVYSEHGLPLAWDLCCLPATSQTCGGDSYLFSVRWAPLRLLDRMEDAGLRLPSIPALGSVGLTAVSLALASGTGPVVVAGLDFAFNPGSYHARSSPSRLDRLFTTTRLHSLLDMAPAIRKGVVQIPGKNGRPVLSDPSLQNYRNLFHREFGKEGRLSDAGSFGLNLGIPHVGMDRALEILNSGSSEGAPSNRAQYGFVAGVEQTRVFMESELGMLERLRGILTGTSPATEAVLTEVLVDDCDYLWAHFPECAAAEGLRPPLTDLSFMKRVRAEIDPFMKAFTIGLAELERGATRPSS